MEKTQRAEVRKIQLAEQQALAVRFREVVLAAEPEAQRAIAPFLQVPVLRRVVQTMANDERGDFSHWATNPLVLEYLHMAKKALEDGLITEQEAEQLMIAQAKARVSSLSSVCSRALTPARAGPEVEPGGGDRVQGAHAAARAPRHGAAGERAERAADGAERRQRRIPRQALRRRDGCVNRTCFVRRSAAGMSNTKSMCARTECYTRAVSILDFVEGTSKADQAEIDNNKVAVLWNMAAAHIAVSEFGAAAEKCTQALALEPDCIRVLLRRAKAYTARGEYALAEADLAKVKDLEPWSFEAEEAEQKLRQARKAHTSKDAAFAAAAMKAATQGKAASAGGKA